MRGCRTCSTFRAPLDALGCAPNALGHTQALERPERARLFITLLAFDADATAPLLERWIADQRSAASAGDGAADPGPAAAAYGVPSFLASPDPAEASSSGTHEPDGSPASADATAQPPAVAASQPATNSREGVESRTGSGNSQGQDV